MAAAAAAALLAVAAVLLAVVVAGGRRLFEMVVVGVGGSVCGGLMGMVWRVVGGCRNLCLPVVIERLRRRLVERVVPVVHVLAPHVLPDARRPGGVRATGGVGRWRQRRDRKATSTTAAAAAVAWSCSPWQSIAHTCRRTRRCPP